MMLGMILPGLVKKLDDFLATKNGSYAFTLDDINALAVKYKVPFKLHRRQDNAIVITRA